MKKIFLASLLAVTLIMVILSIPITPVLAWEKPKILFDESHEQTEYEPVSIDGYFLDLASILRSRYGFTVNKVTTGPITESLLSQYTVFVLPTPVYPLSPSEIDAIESYVENGGSLLLLYEWGDLWGADTNLEPLGSIFGIHSNMDAVMHPTHNTGDVYSILVSRMTLLGKLVTMREGRKIVLYAASSFTIEPPAHSLALSDFDGEPANAPLVVEATYGKGKVIAVGDFNWMDNTDWDENGVISLDEYGNLDYALMIFSILTYRIGMIPPLIFT